MKKSSAPPAEHSNEIVRLALRAGHVLIGVDVVKQKMDWRSDNTVYTWIKDRGFPRPVKGSHKHARWILSEVDSFIEKLPRSKQAA